MSVVLSPIGNDAPFVDSSGNPLNGGLLYTYTAGSTTAQNTYTTSAGNVANANPVVLDSAGYPSSASSVVEIWLTAGVSYKFVLKNAAGVTLWTRDNISGINDTVSSLDQWVSGPAPTYVSATSFTLVGDQTSAFHVGRRVKTTNTAGTAYSTISVSAFAALTTITVVNDSTTLDSGLSAVSYGLLSAINVSNPVATPAGSTTIPAVFAQGDTNTGIYFPAADSLGVVVGGTEVARSKAAGSSFYRKNRLKNASFAVDQRVNSATSRADDVYGLDCWYTLTQTAAINVTQSALQENGQPYNIRLTQAQAGAQRMGVAQIIEARDSQADRGRVMTLSARIRCSSAQAIRYAILEWTGTADTVTSDVVNDWTSGTYTAGNFFLAASLTVTAVGSITPSANTWTAITALNGTLGSSVNNLVVLFWTEGTAAQNVTLDVGVVQLEHGSIATEFEYRAFDRDLIDCKRFLPVYQSLSTNDSVVTGQCISTTQTYVYIPLDVQTRISCTAITVSNVAHFSFADKDGVLQTGTGLAFSAANPRNVRLLGTVAAGLVAGNATSMQAVSASGQILFTGAEM